MLDPTRKLQGILGTPGVAGVLPQPPLAGMGANGIQQISGLPQVYEKPSNSGRWGQYIVGAFTLFGW